MNKFLIFFDANFSGTAEEKEAASFAAAVTVCERVHAFNGNPRKPIPNCPDDFRPEEIWPGESPAYRGLVGVSLGHAVELLPSELGILTSEETVALVDELPTDPPEDPQGRPWGNPVGGGP